MHAAVVRRRGGVRHRDDQRPRARRARQDVRAASPDDVPLRDYLRELRYLGLAPGWATQELRLQFDEAMQKLSEIEPLAALFIQDQLRGSPLLLYSQVLDSAFARCQPPRRRPAQAASARHRRRLQRPQPGAGARHASRRARHEARRGLPPDGIYVLPETVADLPPLAGILTAGAGNPLSHVQLLARNLGIPNVAVDESLLPRAAPERRQAHRAGGQPGRARGDQRGRSAVGRGVRHAKRSRGRLVFEPDLGKLDLSTRDFVSLDGLRAEGLGAHRRSEGGEARRAEVALPRPRRAGGRDSVRGVSRGRAGPALQEHRQDGLRMDGRGLPRARGDAGRARARQQRSRRGCAPRSTRPSSAPTRVRNSARRCAPRWTASSAPTSAAASSCARDTNVEDLPGFTGAGLNLTLLNVVGFENIVKAHLRGLGLALSPRAWAWRQSHMKGPEHVYPAVLLLRTVPSDISGVMITQDVDTGDLNVLSVAVNEGVGARSKGRLRSRCESTEATASARLMAAATAPRSWCRRPRAASRGCRSRGARPCSGPARSAADRVRRRNPQAVPAARRGRQARPGRRGVRLRGRQALAAADPAVQRKPRGARRRYLVQMDKALEANLGRTVDMREALR